MTRIYAVKESLRRNLLRASLPVLAAGGVLIGAQQPAHAVLLGYSLTISDATLRASDSSLPITVDKNVPNFLLENTSGLGSNAKLKSFTMTIGNTAANFDMIRKDQNTSGVAPDGPAGGTLTLLSPADTDNGGSRVDSYTFDLTGFDPSETITWNVDIDSDLTGDSTAETYDGGLGGTPVFWNNGAATPNAVVTVVFDLLGQEHTLQQSLGSDNLGISDSYTFTQSLAVETPEPGTLALMGVGLLGLVSLRRMRRAA